MQVILLKSHSLLSCEGHGGSMSYVVGLPNNHTSLSPIWRGFAPGFVNYKKGCTRLASDTVYQLLAHCQWLSPASSTTKTGRHDIHVAEILLKVMLKHQKSNQN